MHQAQCGPKDKQHVNASSRAHCGDDRHAFGRGADEPPRLLIERCHKLALREPNQVGTIDNIDEMAFQACSSAGQAWHAPRECNEVSHKRTAIDAIVAKDYIGSAL